MHHLYVVPYYSPPLLKQLITRLHLTCTNTHEELVHVNVSINHLHRASVFRQPYAVHSSSYAQPRLDISSQLTGYIGNQ